MHSFLSPDTLPSGSFRTGTPARMDMLYLNFFHCSTSGRSRMRVARLLFFSREVMSLCASKSLREEHIQRAHGLKIRSVLMPSHA